MKEIIQERKDKRHAHLWME